MYAPKRPRRTNESLVEELRGIYGDAYDLSKMVRVGPGVVTLFCDKHGAFTKSMQTHRNWGLGCKLCNPRARYENKIAERAAGFEARSREVHGDKYQYHKTKYIGSQSRVNVTCPEHGDFPVIASSHLRGQGCPYCSGASTCDSEFKARILKIHGAGITVGPVTDMRHKLDAACNECGKTWRPWPRSLLDGHGCPICNRVDVSGFDMAKPAKLYLLRFTLQNRKEVFKLGITCQPIKKRVQGMQLQGRATYEILGVTAYEKGVHAYEDECELKSALLGYSYVGEAFANNGSTEMFSIDPRLVVKDLEFEHTEDITL